MPSLDPAQLDGLGRYRLLINSVVPRPIAWVTTINAAGVVNLAPFSFFNGVTAKPPTLMISIGYRDPVKDTLANLRENQQAVIHVPGPGSMAAIHQSGAEYGQAVSEANVLELDLVASERVAPPRVSECPIAFECRLVQEIPVGEPAATMCLLQIELAHIADEIALEDGMPDPERHLTVARLGERCYLDAADWVVHALPKQQVPHSLSRGQQ